MRTPEEQRIALDCLRLAASLDPSSAVEAASKFYAFVTGDDVDDAKAKLAAIREAVS